MPKIKVKVIKTKIDDKGRKLVVIQCDRKMPKEGTIADLSFGSKRSIAQNALLWVYYTWLINVANLKDQGFFCPEALHVSLKAHFLSTKIMERGQWKIIEQGSSADLDKIQFGELFEKIDNFICDFFGISTAEFWQQYERDWKM